MAELDDRRHAWLVRLAPAGAFVVGVALGGLVVAAAVGNEAPADDGSSAATPPTTTGTPPDTEVVIPGTCTEAAETVRQAVTLLQDGVASVRDFDPDELVRVLDELERLEVRARDLADQCAAVEVNPETTG